MIKNVILLIVSAVVIALALYNSISIHLPIISILACALIVGYFEPQKGWISSLILVAIVFSLHFLFSFLEIHPQNIESETFATYISPLPALFGGLMGSFFQKTFNS